MNVNDTYHGKHFITYIIVKSLVVHLKVIECYISAILQLKIIHTYIRNIKRKYTERCYGLNICVPLHSYVERWWYLEVGHLGGDWVVKTEPSLMELVTLRKRPHRALSSLPSCVITVRKELSVKKQALTKHLICQCHDLGLPASRIVRMLLLSQPV